MAIPSTPNNYNIQQANSQVYLSWDISAGATTYQVGRSTDNISFSIIASPATNYYLDTSATVNTQYYYQVASTNVDGTSPYTASQGIVPVRQGKMSLGQIRLLAQQRADRVNSNFVTMTEWNRYINQSYFELYDLLTTVYEDYYMATPFIFQTSASDLYPLPDGVLTDALTSVVAKPFYKMRGLDLGLSTNTNAWVTVHKFDFIERNRFVYPQVTGSYLGVFNLRYRVIGDNILLIPSPSGQQFLRLWYQPRLDELLQDIDTLDGVSGWTEYVVIDAARKALLKEESDTQALDMEKQVIKSRIEGAAINRDISEPDTISDTMRYAGGRGFGANGDGGYGGY